MEVESDTEVEVESYYLSGSERLYPTSPVFLRNGASLTFKQDFPSEDVAPDSEGRLKLGLNRVRIENVGEGTRIRAEYTLRGFVTKLLAGLVLVLLIWGAIHWGGGCGLALIAWIPALFFLIAGMITSRSILIDPAENQVHVQTTYLGFLELQPTLLTDPVALVPDGYTRANVVLLHKSEGKMKATFLFELDYDQLGGLAALAAEIQNSTPADAAAAESEGEDDLPPKAPATEENDSTWVFFYRMLGRALPHLGRALLHLIVLAVGSFIIFGLAAGIAEQGSYSLPFDQFFIIALVGTGFSPFFGWTSTGILLAIYAFLMTVGALVERYRYK